MMIYSTALSVHHWNWLLNTSKMLLFTLKPTTLQKQQLYSQLINTECLKYQQAHVYADEIL